MQLTFAGTIIAREPTEGGTDAIEGFIGKRRSLVQVAELIRVTDSPLYPRFNRRRTLTGTITYGAFSTLSAAMQKLLLNYDSLPDLGTLQILVGGETTLYSVAILESPDAKKRMGVTVSATLTFQIGVGLNIGNGILTDESGNDLTDQSGNNLTS